jgi:nitroreductase
MVFIEPEGYTTEAPMKPPAMLELIKDRRVVRRFDPGQPVSAQALERILEAALWSPLSIYHPLGRKFIALSGDERDRAVEILLRDHTVLKYIRFRYDNALIGHDEEWSRMAEYFGKTLGEAPVVVVALVQRDPHVDRQAHNLGASWCAAQNMMLQAAAEGLGSGVVTLGSPKVQGDLIEHLGLDPDQWMLACVVNLGYAAETPMPLQRPKEGIEVRG